MKSNNTIILRYDKEYDTQNSDYQIFEVNEEIIAALSKDKYFELKGFSLSFIF